jgi:SET domain
MTLGNDINFWLIDTKTAQSSIHGIGRFSQQQVSADDIVLVLGGRIGTSGSMPIYGTKLFMDNPQTHINHSHEPNLYLDGQIIFRASRHIASGEELTLDYTKFSKLTFVPMVSTQGAQ